ncbi:MAG: TadE/TadG family type IV pilus assembly protein [Candidatus Dormibacteria bacterium]
MRRRPDDPEAGQTLVIFALMGFFICGVIALGVDYGFLSNQHRTLQAYADASSLAGAKQLGANPQPADYQGARQTAFVYLRQSLFHSTSPSLAAVASACGIADWSVNPVDCDLPAPNQNYHVKISSPSETLSWTVIQNQNLTVSVRITESVATAFAAIFPQSRASPGALAVAQYQASSSGPFTLYSDGTVSAGNQLQIVSGDVYIDKGTLAPQSGGLAAFCAESGPAGSGNITFGPLAAVPPGIQVDQSEAACQGASGGQVLTMGNYSQSSQSIPPPTYAPPPNVPACSGCGVATATHQCLNGTTSASGGPIFTCFDPGAYTNFATSISNNLNPGIYHVVGAADGTGTVSFSDNTLNANFRDVVDQCWKPPGNVGGTFTAPCPSGFEMDPTASVDLGCPFVGTAPATPTFTLAPAITGGALPAGTYYVRVAALNSFGTTATSEVSAVVLGSGAGSIGVNITADPLATAGFQVYVSTSSGTEIALPSSGTQTQVIQVVPSSGRGYPHFSNSSCTNFHNIPLDKSTNYGVTFVLDNQVGFNVSGKLTVMLSPYCDAAPYPGHAGHDTLTCWPSYSSSAASINDGAFVIYGESTGSVTESDTGTQFGMTGTVDVEKMSISIGQNAIWAVVPGQVVAHDFLVQSGNHTNPTIVGDPSIGGHFPPSLRLIE